MAVSDKSESYDSPTVRGQRIREIRNALGLTRDEFADRHNIKTSTLQAWEIGRFDGIPEKKLKQLIEAFAKEGIECRPEWLYYGIGDHPFKKSSADIEPTSSDEALNTELQLFLKHNNDVIDAIISDTHLVPFYYPGDIVAGTRYFDESIKNALNHVCIVKTSSGETLVRLLKPGSDNNTYSLMLLKNGSLVYDHRNTRVLYAAPITWVRRNLSTSKNPR